MHATPCCETSQTLSELRLEYGGCIISTSCLGLHWGELQGSRTSEPASESVKSCQDTESSMASLQWSEASWILPHNSAPLTAATGVPVGFHDVGPDDVHELTLPDMAGDETCSSLVQGAFLTAAFVSHLLMAVPKKQPRRSSLGRGRAHPLPWQPETNNNRGLAPLKKDRR